MVLEGKLPASLKEKWNLKKQKDPENTSSVLDLDDWILTRALSKEETKNVFAALSASKALHGSEFRLPKRSMGPPGSSEMAVPSAPTVEAYLATATHSEERKRRVLFKIVPVRIRSEKSYFDTFAFLDSGSDTTLLRSDVAKETLGLSGPRKRVKSYDGVVTNVDATDVPVTISSVNEKRIFKVSNAYSIDTLRAASNPPITKSQHETWHYLRGVVVVNVKPVDVPVLIGIDIPQAHNHTAAIEPPEGVVGPVAFETPFGWCLAGKMGPDDEEESPFVSHVAAITTEESFEALNEQVKKFLQLESKDVYVEKPVLSEDDLRGERILKNSIVNVGKRYQVSLM